MTAAEETLAFPGPGGVLRTKFFAPRPSEGLIHRRRLVDRLERGLSRRWTLVCAPAGYGKSTLTGAWLHGRGEFAWLSLDEHDSDPGRFWHHFLIALTRFSAELGVESRRLLERAGDSVTGKIVATLCNELADAQPPPDDGCHVVVLDDFHLIDDHEVVNGVRVLLDQLPAHWHIVIVTREEPALDLARHRARNAVSELGADQLRFGETEIAEFFERRFALELDSLTLAVLERKTEGWAASLQLAGLSLRDAEGHDRQLRDLSGDQKLIMDYLLEDVFARQPDATREVLLRICVLERFCASLCQAMLADGSAENSGAMQALIEELLARNLFVVPLDSHGKWFRLHPLLLDMLRARLRRSRPEETEGLHRRAAEWLERHDLHSEALVHVLEIEDWDWVERLASQVGEQALTSGNLSRLRDWLRRIPARQTGESHTLSLLSAWLQMLRYAPEMAGKHLRHVHDLIEGMPPGTAREATKTEAEILDAWCRMAALRGRRKELYGPIVSLAMDTSRRLQALPDTKKARSHIAIADVCYQAGRLADAKEACIEAVRIGRRLGSPLTVAAGLMRAIDVSILQGQLDEASDLGMELGRFVDGTSQPGQPSDWFDYARASVLYQRGDTPGTIALLRPLFQRCIVGGEFWMAHDVGVDLALALSAVGQFDEARAVASQCLTLSESHLPARDWRALPADACLARIELARGNVAGAQRWAHRVERRVASEDVAYTNELEFQTLARYRIQDGESAAAVVLLEALIEDAVKNGRMLRVLECRVLLAVALQAGTGNDERSLAATAAALAQAAGDNIRRPFLEQASLSGQLEAAVTRGVEARFAGGLLNELPKQSGSPLAGERFDALSEREIEVVRLIDLGLSNQQIAENLFISIHTVKAHNRSIFSKLDVSRRTEALVRARSLGLLRTH